MGKRGKRKFEAKIGIMDCEDFEQGLGFCSKSDECDWEYNMDYNFYHPDRSMGWQGNEPRGCSGKYKKEDK